MSLIKIIFKFMNKIRYYYLILRKVILTRNLKYLSKKYRLINGEFQIKGVWCKNNKTFSLQDKLK